ncbi:MAG: fumarate hydratase [bacterium]
MSRDISFINTEKITEIVSKLCKHANLYVSQDVYKQLYNAYKKESFTESKNVLWQILENMKIASEIKRPICQDTGFVVVFAEIGQNVHLDGGNFEDAINLGIEKAYTKNKFRYSIVQDPVFERTNTNTNAPAVIHTKIIPGNTIKLSLVIKGCGSENMGVIKMLKPFAGADEIINFAVEAVKNSARNTCPPVRLGIGIGGTMDYATFLSKKALLQPVKSEEELELSDDKVSQMELKILKMSNELKIGASGFGGDTTVFGVNILSYPTHIAALPVALNFSCHASRYAFAEVFEDEVKYKFQPDYEFGQTSNVEENINKVQVDDFEEIKLLKAGDRVSINGYIYTARDAAHQKMIETINNGQELPFDIKNKIIYYVGPCPPIENEIIGPAGPTTAARMDKYTPALMDRGLIGSIGKGKRNEEVIESIKKNKGVYFITTGGTACLLASKIKEAEVIAYPELGAEAIYKLKIENFPVTVAIDSDGNNIFKL